MMMLPKKNHCQPSFSHPAQRVLELDLDENLQIWVKCRVVILDIIQNQKQRKRKLIRNILCSKHFVKLKLPNCFFNSLILLQGNLNWKYWFCITGVIWSIRVTNVSRILRLWNLSPLEFLIFWTQRRCWIRKNIWVMYKIIDWNKMVTRQQVGLKWDIIVTWWKPIRIKCTMKVISANFNCSDITWGNESFKLIG